MIQISSKNLKLRLVEERDSDFIYNLRLLRGMFLNNTNFTQSSNRTYIQNYRNRIQECVTEGNSFTSYYFAIDVDNAITGTVRLYDIDYQYRYFTWGSWILSQGGGV